jgi:hypothetical protein
MTLVPTTLCVCGTRCEHDFQDWRDFADGTGGEQVCVKCGPGAISATMWGLYVRLD